MELAKAQEILTAEKYLELLGEQYGSIKDYQAKIVITSNKTDMFGTIIYKTPNLLRIDFTKPEGQVIVFNGNTLTVYLPEYRAILNQEVSTNNSAVTIASAQGLSLLRRNYLAAYAVGPDPIPMDEGSSSLVIKLLLTRRNLSEGFTQLELSIDPEAKLIRRIKGTTVTGEEIILNFSDIVLNQGIAEAKFVYDSPASANLYNNFLFKSTE
jgi:outer membrane lipoprotein-sorting protein